MKVKLIIPAVLLLAACKEPAKESKVTEKVVLPIEGTWKLASALQITKGDTVSTYPVAGQKDEMIKILNADHFAFLRHDLDGNKGKRIYDSGAGTYTLEGDNYTENLKYYTNRAWEGNSFKFKVTFKGDSLIQKGIEKIDSLKIDHEIVETYIKLK